MPHIKGATSSGMFRKQSLLGEPKRAWHPHLITYNQHVVACVGIAWRFLGESRGGPGERARGFFLVKRREKKEGTEGSLHVADRLGRVGGAGGGGAARERRRGAHARGSPPVWRAGAAHPPATAGRRARPLVHQGCGCRGSPPRSPSPESIDEHLLGGTPLPAQPKAPTASSCPGGCAGQGVCDTSAAPATCLCHAGFVGSDCRTAHYQGYALLLDAGSQARTPPMGKWPSFTLSLWVRLTATAHAQSFVLFEAGNGDVVVAIDSNNRVTFTVKGNSPSRAVFTNGKLKPFTWTHVGVVYSRRHAGRTGTGSTTLYMDGLLVQTLGYSGVAAATTNVDIKMGTIGSRRNTDASAIVDEVRLFSHALSPAVMKQHPYGRLSGKERNLLAYYRLDEGALSVLRDHAESTQRGIKHDGSLNAAGGRVPRWVQSWAPFEACTLRCSDHGKCLVQYQRVLNTRCASVIWVSGVRTVRFSYVRVSQRRCHALGMVSARRKRQNLCLALCRPCRLRKSLRMKRGSCVTNLPPASQHAWRAKSSF